jgi:hypothetical protein
MRWERVAWATATFVNRDQHAMSDVADNTEPYCPHHRRFAVRRRKAGALRPSVCIYKVDDLVTEYGTSF